MTAKDARFVALYERHHRRIYAYCRRRTRADRVEDAVADIFLTAWRRIDDVPRDEETLPWLYGVAYRVLGHQLRGASRQSKLRKKLESASAAPVPTPDDYLIVDQDSTEILTALSRLRPSEQEVLRLSVWEELSHREIAEVLSLSTDAAKKRFSRAKKNLAQEFNRTAKRRMKSPAAQKGGAW